MKLAASLLLALTACYEPDAIDCTISCAAPDDCASGQVCGSDHLCAAPDVAGHCAGNDTDQPPATALVALKITIVGEGKVSVDGIGSCDSREMPTCTFSVTANQPRQLKAVEGGDREFVGWSEACASATSESCELTLVTALTSVGAEFK